MTEVVLEQVRAAMFTDPGVTAVDDLCLVPGKEHSRAIAATITVAAPSVDLDLCAPRSPRCSPINSTLIKSCCALTIRARGRHHPLARL